MTYNINLKNLFVGTKKDGLTVLDIQQTEENGVYTLEHTFMATTIEKKEKVDIYNEVWHYYQDAMHDGGKAMQVLEWLDDLCCSLDELPEKIVYKCERDEYYRNDILLALNIDEENYDDEIRAVYNDGDDEFMLLDDYYMENLCDIWKTDIQNTHMIKLFAYLTVCEEKPYGEKIAREIYELVEKINHHSIEDYVQAYVDNNGLNK